MKLDMMTEQDLRRLVLSKLQLQGLSAFIDLSKSQFLEMSLSHNNFFAEVVLTDANRLTDAERALRSVKGELVAKEVSLEYIVRALWRIESEIVSRETVPASTGLPMKRALGILFRARLQSGPET